MAWHEWLAVSGWRIIAQAESVAVCAESVAVCAESVVVCAKSVAVERCLETVSFCRCLRNGDKPPCQFALIGFLTNSPDKRGDP